VSEDVLGWWWLTSFSAA